MAEPIVRNWRDSINWKHTVYVQQFVPNQCLPAGSTSSVYNTKVWAWNNSMSGFRNPRWRSQVAVHQNATTTLTGYKLTCVSSQAFLVWTYKYLCHSGNPDKYTDRSETIVGEFQSAFPGSVNPISFSSTIANAAAAGFYNKVNQTISPVEGGVILAELRETLHLLRHPLSGIKRLLLDHDRRVRKIKKSSPRRPNSPGVRSAIRESWLEVVFGWQPLNKDIGDVLLYLQTDRERLRQDFRDVSYTAEGHTVLQPRLLYFGAASSSQYNQDCTKYEVLQYSCRQAGQVRLAVGDSQNRSFTELGLLPEKFLPTAWEIIPYSFVVDYFTNVGKVISAFSVPSSRIAWLYRTERAETRLETGGKPKPNWMGSPGQSTIIARNVSRSVPVNLGLPNFEWDPYVGLKRALNITALLDGIVSRHSRR